MLEAALQEYLSKYESICPEIVNEVMTSMYVDNLTSGVFSREEVLELKTLLLRYSKQEDSSYTNFTSTANIKTSEESLEVIIKGMAMIQHTLNNSLELNYQKWKS